MTTSKKMKQLFLIPIIICASLSFGQTNVIALKSHAGNPSQLNEETDNFGLPSNTIDSIIYLGDRCILQVSHHFSNYYNRDTICEPYLFVQHDFDLSKIRPMYSKNVVFKGFENYEGKSKKSKRSKGAIPLVIGLVVATGYFFTSRTKISIR